MPQGAGKKAADPIVVTGRGGFPIAVCLGHPRIQVRVTDLRDGVAELNGGELEQRRQLGGGNRC